MEILESSLRRIGEVDGRPGSLEDRELTDEDRAKVHAFITVSDERALAKALEIDGMIASGEDPGPLGRRAFYRQGYLSASKEPPPPPRRASWRISLPHIPPRRWNAWKQPAR